MLKKEMNAKHAWHVLYTLLQWTWGLPQNLAGLVVWLHFQRKMRVNQRNEYFHGALVMHWPSVFSMGLGMFIFMGPYQPEVERAVLVHEYGHTIQSLLLGPLFIFVIGIPSLIWCRAKVFVRGRREGRWNYMQFYPERWANWCGRTVLHQEPPKS